MSKLSEWIGAATENRLFTAAVAAVVVTTAVYNGDLFENKIESKIESKFAISNPELSDYEDHLNYEVRFHTELAAFNENYFHLADALKAGDKTSAIDIVSKMKNDIGEMKTRLIKPLEPLPEGSGFSWARVFDEYENEVQSDKIVVVDSALKSIENTIQDGKPDVLERLSETFQSMNDLIAIMESPEDEEHEEASLGM